MATHCTVCCCSDLGGALTGGGGGIEDEKGSRVSARWSRLLKIIRITNCHWVETCVLKAHEMAENGDPAR